MDNDKYQLMAVMPNNQNLNCRVDLISKDKQKELQNLSKTLDQNPTNKAPYSKMCYGRMRQSFFKIKNEFYDCSKVSFAFRFNMIQS